ncbi:MAG: heavy-metal-associated domain-containing protein [Flavobacterium sp.]
MKKILVILMVFTILISCKNEEYQKHPDAGKVTQPKPALRADAQFVTASFKIDGMHCKMGCAASLQKKIFNMEGVKTSKIDFENKSATIVFDKNVMTTEKIIEKVLATDKTYVVSDIKTEPNL